MSRKLQFSSPLEAALAKVKKKEGGLWGKMQSWSHQRLARLEAHPFLQNYGALARRPRNVMGLRPEPVIDLDSLFLLSLLFHILIFLLLSRVAFPPKPTEQSAPTLVRLFDLGEPSQEGKERTKKALERTARAQRPIPATAPTAAAKAVTASETPQPSLPAPKVLAEAPKEKAVGLTGEPVQNLIRLPTRQPGGAPASLATQIDPLPGTLTGGGVALPEKLRGRDSVQGAGGGGSSGVAALSSPDFAPYLERIKKRVQSVWKYPEGISGRHQINLLFVLDRAGKLVRVELLDSTDPSLNSSAIEAMKRASPFPPVPESLKELAGWPLRMRFSIDFGVKIAQ